MNINVILLLLLFFFYFSTSSILNKFTQTGNSIFLGLSIAGVQLEVLHADRSVLALISFW